jgi:hypothetical protein
MVHAVWMTHPQEVRSRSAKALPLFHPAKWDDIVIYSCTTTSPPAMVAGAL